MEESRQLKRPRENEEQQQEREEEVLKRQKSFKDIINLLEEEEDEPTEDLSSLISTLQEELSYGPGSATTEPGPYETDPENQPSTAGSSVSGEEEEEGERVMKHLLEASDDELGIPNTEGFDFSVEGQVDGGDLLLPPFGDGLWEFEDHEAANYYSLLQSEILL